MSPTEGPGWCCAGGVGERRALLSMQKTQLQQLLFKNEERDSSCCRMQFTNELFSRKIRTAIRADSKFSLDEQIIKVGFLNCESEKKH